MPKTNRHFIGAPVTAGTFKKIKLIADAETGGDLSALFLKFIKEGIRRKSK
jgi:hypothetical protein